MACHSGWATKTPSTAPFTAAGAVPCQGSCCLRRAPLHSPWSCALSSLPFCCPRLNLAGAGAQDSINVEVTHLDIGTDADTSLLARTRKGVLEASASRAESTRAQAGSHEATAKGLRMLPERQRHPQ